MVAYLTPAGTPPHRWGHQLMASFHPFSVLQTQTALQPGNWPAVLRRPRLSSRGPRVIAQSTATASGGRRVRETCPALSNAVTRISRAAPAPLSLWLDLRSLHLFHLFVFHCSALKWSWWERPGVEQSRRELTPSPADSSLASVSHPGRGQVWTPGAQGGFQPLPPV